MSTPALPKATLARIRAKLHRSNENIINLQSQIDALLGPDRERVIHADNHQAIQDFINAHVVGRVPPRISVLAAECVHNLRSTLDQLARQLVLANGNRPKRDEIKFPLLLKDPATTEDPETRHKATTSYNRNVKGMSDTAQAYILSLQPYQPENGGRDHKLRILHDLNITDKHREIVLLKNAFGTAHRLSFKPQGVGLHRITVGNVDHGIVPITFDRPVTAMEANTVATIHVVFSDFGDSRLVPVTYGLWSVYQCVQRVVTDLAGEFRE
jgi:hypothetical protein